MDFPLVSVIIPTYNREKPLRDTLADLVEQEYPNFETLVIDQTPVHQPETQAYLQELASQGKIKLYKLEWASLPGARNYGIRRAAGEIILFIDDDVRLKPGFLQAHVRNFVEKSEVGVVAGRVLDPHNLKDNQDSQTDYTIEYLPKEASDAGIVWYYLDFTHTIKPQVVLSARGCNMSFRRDIFDKYKLSFDERYQGSAVREESDLCLRVRQTGYKIWYDPEAVLIHLGEPTGGCHDISTRTLQYQITHYHNHFWMAFQNLTFGESVRLFIRLFDCHVLGNPPCNKSGSFSKIVVRGIFYFLGLISALLTWVQSLWSDGQIYSQLDPESQTTI
jgi:GT2 family glycosyltransferase